MKTILAFLILCTGLTASAQFYQLKTNLTQTNVIAASATLTYAGTNYLDVTRWRSIGIVHGFDGSNTNTNTVTYSYRVGATSTNWETLPVLTLAVTSYGTNHSEFTTNIPVMGFGFIKPYQIVNACTNSLTNAFQWGQLKEFPRN